MITRLLASSSYLVLNKDLIRIFGLDCAVFISEIAGEKEYWQEKDKLEEGWFYSTIDNIEENTGLSDFEQRKAINKLQKCGILECKRQGLPAKRYIKINEEQLIEFLKKHISTNSRSSSLIFKELDIDLLKCNNNNSNNTNNSNNNNNNSEKNDFSQKQKRFVKPTIEEIRQYCEERNNVIDAEHFFDYYESVGWMLSGGKKIKDWQACVRTWEKQKKEKNSAQKERKVELNPEIAELKEVFCNFYREKVGMVYNWSDRESISLIELANKIGAEIQNDTTLRMNFEAMLRRLPDWYKKNGLDINIINKNFNNIKNQIKNGEENDYDYLMRKYSARI